MQTIKEVVANRKIKYLVHFTRIENVPGILEYGIVPRDAFSSLPYIPIISDLDRYDKMLTYTNVSIMFPNYLMFYRKKESNGYIWALIVLDVSLMSDRDCLFSPDNTARNNSHISMKKGVAALLSLFNENPKKGLLRNELGIPDSYPTNPQAEVLVPGIIDPTYIKAVVVKTLAEAAALRNTINYKVDVIVNKKLFQNRKDHWYWVNQ